MDCYRCAERIKTPNADYSVAELIELCRPHCIGCDPTEMPRGGRSQVAFVENTIASTSPSEPTDGTDDDAPAAEDKSAFRISPDYLDALRPCGQATKLSDETEDALRKIVCAIADLDFRELTVFWGLLRGMNYGEIADALGLKSGRQCVFARIKAAVRKHPWMNALHVRKAANAR